MADQHANDDLKAKMREALDRKNGAKHPDDHAAAKGKAHGSEVVGAHRRCTDARPAAGAPERNPTTSTTRRRRPPP